jgi:putative ABC transport system permease protein
MFYNHVKLALRNLWRNQVSSIVNITGLTIGLSSCFLIALYVQDEFSFDTLENNRQRIARVIMEYSIPGHPEVMRGNFTSTKVAPVFSRTFPEIESAVRMADRDMIVKHSGDNLTMERGFMFADSSFFKTFSYHFLRGNPGNALDGPRKVVLTESTSKRYFGADDPVGKVLLIGSSEIPYEVTGVMKDYPSNSQLKFDFLASFSSMGANQEETYFDANYTTYFLLRDAESFSSLQSKITPFMKKEMEHEGAVINFFLEPFDKIHLHSEYAGFVPNTSITFLYVLSGVALLILVILCFTYINLGTAHSLERAREVGLRKLAGAARRQLFWQFVGESFVLFLISVMLSLSLAYLAIPYFNELTQNQLHAIDLFSPSFLLFSFSVAVIVSILAGSYPAIVLTRFQPAKVLKGLFSHSDSGRWMQRSLIIFQFAITVFLLVTTLVIQQQLNFIRNKKLGYDRNHILTLPMNDKMIKDIDAIKREMTSHPDILNVSRCVSTPVHIAGGYSMRTADMPEDDGISVTASPIDEDYLKTTGLHLVAGEDLTAQDCMDVLPEDPAARIYHYILNESAAKVLGWTPEEAIQKKLFLGNHRPGLVKGVVADFHFESMHSRIKPVVLFTEMRGHGNLLVKISGMNIPSTISFIESKWKQLVPYIPFEYRFLNEDYAKLYRSELRLGDVMSLFSGIAIVLACLGLFGLSSFVAKRRIKEIGIRKILGASLISIVTLLTRSFTGLILAAITIAIPIAYVVIQQWLNGFAYHVALSIWVFGIGALTALTIALLTVSIHGINAARRNPATTLRSE